MNILVGGFYQNHLLKHLLIEQKYNPLERPVQNDSQTLPVSINLALQQIIDFVSDDETSLYFIHFLNMNRMEKTKLLLLMAI